METRVIEVADAGLRTLLAHQSVPAVGCLSRS